MPKKKGKAKGTVVATGRKKGGGRKGRRKKPGRVSVGIRPNRGR
jgi:hypothetical protein